MIEQVLYTVAVFLLPYLTPLILLLGAVLYADRLIDLLKSAIGSKVSNGRRSNY